MYSTWNCNECKKLMGDVGDLYQTKDATDTVVAFLQGKAFCEDPGPGSGDPNTCKQEIQMLMPPATMELGKGIKMAAPDLCHTVFAMC